MRDFDTLPAPQPGSALAQEKARAAQETKVIKCGGSTPR